MLNQKRPSEDPPRGRDSHPVLRIALDMTPGRDPPILVPRRRGVIPEVSIILIVITYCVEISGSSTSLIQFVLGRKSPTSKRLSETATIAVQILRKTNDLLLTTETDQTRLPQNSELLHEGSGRGLSRVHASAL